MSDTEQSQNFTQKDLMQHLLNVTQHAATREELNAARIELKEIALKASTREELQEVKTELKSELQEVKTELKSELQEVKTELKEIALKAATREELLEVKEIALKAATREELQQVKTELESRLTIRLGSIMVVGIGTLAVLMKVL